jgi:hypothetical protein
MHVNTAEDVGATYQRKKKTIIVLKIPNFIRRIIRMDLRKCPHCGSTMIYFNSCDKYFCSTCVKGKLLQKNTRRIKMYEFINKPITPMSYDKFTELLYKWVGENFTFNNRMIFYADHNIDKMTPLPKEIQTTNINLDKRNYLRASDALIKILAYVSSAYGIYIYEADQENDKNKQ